MKNRKFELALVVAVVACTVVWFHGKPSSIDPKSTSSNVAYPVADADVYGGSPQHLMEIRILWKSQFDAAQAALGQGDNKTAETLLLDALHNAPQAGVEALHETLDDLGLVCYRLGDYPRSADFQAQAIEAAKKLNRPDRDATVGLYESRYAKALAALSKKDDALAALERARLAYAEAYPAGSPAYADALKELAAQHRTLGDNEGAAKLLGE